MAINALAKKMHLKPGYRARVLNAPDGHGRLLEPLPDGVELLAGKAKDVDWVLLFVHDSKELKRHAAGAVQSLKPEGLLWIAYPKKTSKIATDLTRDEGWSVMADVDMEICSMVAVDATWSCARFRRKSPAAAETKKPSENMSDEAVKAATGKVWDEWFAILDKEGAKTEPHPEIARLLHEKHGLTGWWSQMVAVGYERARGLRAVNERTDGYSVSRSKTVDTSAERAFTAWQETKKRGQFLPEKGIAIHKATPPKSLRVTWIDGRKVVDVAIYPKGADRCQVVVQHNKLADAKTAERMKTYWEECLLRMKEALEA
jgi:hypothetical protein